MAYTTIDNPELYFQTKLYTGNGTAIGSGGLTVTFDGSENMQPDWVWIKNRDGTDWHDLFDSVRGVTKRLYSNSNNAENTNTEGLTAFGTNGFTVGNSGDVNTNTNNHVSWNWKAGGSASSNSDGSITSSVSASTTAGFSIVSYTGTGANATVGHGLGSKPKFIIIKSRDKVDNWHCYNESIGATKVIWLDLTSASASTSTFMQDTEPTSSVFSLGTNTAVNTNTFGHIAYCFTDVKGYSKFGSYTGNGNADGTFVYTGFSPAFIIFKRTNTTNDWFMVDNKINPFNVTDKMLRPNLSNAEQSFNNIDFLSNGFKPRGASDGFNASGSTYIYMCFASSPFTTSTGIPTTAR